MMWRTDGQTDGRTPYHNTSEVSLRAYKNGSTHSVRLPCNAEEWF